MKETKRNIGIKFFGSADFRLIGFIIAIEPRTSPILAILEPIAFPIARFGAFFRAAAIDTCISGAEVASETIVEPIITVGILKLCARKVAPCTNLLVPQIRSNIPKQTKRISISIRLDMREVIFSLHYNY
jgi:hypothetical protein